ncbi:MAG: UDP-N-acetylglucosamine 2-epimerase (non-hydrolyzing) [Ignavibacteriales bacterium]|nr:UDP-N-acetylglucosamine 2-epimerase (non-hydrolyzing) [Ignavibacteriales bacterium]
MKVISVVGARPNFMKVAPIHKAFIKFTIENPETSIQHLICHTGQHYDANMSKVFFEDLELPKPNFYLGVGSGSHAEQTAKVMIEFEKILGVEKPDLVIVVGDVNSTIACSLTAAKLNIKTAHVEAGLRSFDRTMPEEINRILTDSIADYLFVSEPSGIQNLLNEGVCNSKMFFVGNTMIDSLLNYISKAESNSILQTLGLKKQDYIVVTLHRPSNVDTVESLSSILDVLQKVSVHKKVVFPIHPRTRAKILEFKLDKFLCSERILFCEPLGYLEFIKLTKESVLVITDSGGIQEETTVLKISCLTVRDNTERPITVTDGTNILVGTEFNKILPYAEEIFAGKMKQSKIPELWDGKASTRVVEAILKTLSDFSC